MEGSYVQLATECPEEDYDLVRELLSYEMRCPISCKFVKDELKSLKFYTVPSPLHWSRQVEWPWVLRNGDFKRTDRVLDIGSGWSVLKFALAKRCRSVTCLEVDPEFIEKAEQAIHVLEAYNVNQIQGDARMLPFPDNTFDKVVSVSVFEHMDTGHIPAVREAVRVLKPGGILLLTMDVVIGGERGTNNFYVDQPKATQLIEELKITQTQQASGPTIGAAIAEDKVEIVVLMVKYAKG